MSEQLTFGKRQLVVETLAARIRRGEFTRGQRLGGEHELAKEFNVSRGTVRQALSELQHRNFITTQSGIGSFVTFDGHALDQRLGWAQALAGVGTPVQTSVLEIAPIAVADIPELPDDVPLSDAIVVRRVRWTQASNGPRMLSFECASIPAVGSLRDLPSTGLKNNSLWASLSVEGFVATRGKQTVDVHTLDEREAEILERKVGTAFLRSIRTSYGADGRFVEHVVSLLDPDRFTLTLAFGGEA